MPFLCIGPSGRLAQVPMRHFLFQMKILSISHVLCTLQVTTPISPCLTLLASQRLLYIVQCWRNQKYTVSDQELITDKIIEAVHTRTWTMMATTISSVHTPKLHPLTKEKNLVTIDNFFGCSFTSRESVFNAVLCKIQASKHYIVSLPSVLKDKRSCFCQGVELPLVHMFALQK